MALAQQQLRQPVPNPHQIRAGILARSHQIPHRLHVGLRHRDRGDLIQPQQPGQMRGITGIGLNPIPGRPDQLRRRSDHAVDLRLGQRASQPEPSRPSLISHPHRTTPLAQPSDNLAVIRA